MGVTRFFQFLFGGGGNAVKETIEVFRPNAEAGEGRAHDAYLAALQQLAAETAAPGLFGAFVDALNRLPRPLITFGALGLFVFAMVDPEAFTVRITALTLIPDPLWYLLGAIVGFYFGARELHKQRQVKVIEAMSALADWRRGAAELQPDPEDPEENVALIEARKRLEARTDA
uniref:holin family protein n=1 Tax=Ruegeria arenilitoris TaxID=1173585 RepID=UPI00147F3E47|nr:holin family protein [Ruegeria arenilitoris]